MELCRTCHAGCCRAYAVPVTGADILSIQQRQGLSFAEIACRWADPERTIARGFAPQFYFADEPGLPFTLCLLKEASRYFPETTRCRFLQENPPDAAHPLGTARCAIHESRPAACRVFPTRLHPSGELAVVLPVVTLSGEPTLNSLCPRQPLPGDFDPLEATQALVLARYEMSFFHKVAEIWNRLGRDWEQFPEFLQTVYQQRIQPDISVSGTEEDQRAA